MLAVIVTAVIMATPGYADQNVILKTNYGYSIETLRPNVPLPDKIYIFPQELRQTRHLMANNFFPLLVLIDKNNAQIDVINLSTADTETTIGQIEYTEATGQIYPVRALENVMNG